MPLPVPRFIYFDLDDTLLDHRRAERAALGDVRSAFASLLGGLSLEDVCEAYHAGNTALWRAYAEARIDKQTLRIRRFEELLDACGVDRGQAEEVGTHYMSCYARHWAYCRGAEAAFHLLADRYPVGLITNGFAEVQRAKLDRFAPLRDRLEVVIISEDIGVLKPHPALFSHAAEAAGVPPEALLYVGDSYTSDVVGARRAGWQVAWYTPSPPDTPEEGVYAFADWQALTTHLLEKSDTNAAPRTKTA